MSNKGSAKTHASRLTTAANFIHHNIDQTLIRLVVGELPNELLSAKRSARKYRRQLETAVTAQHGRVGVRAAHDIDLATGAETVAAIARWLLCHRWNEMAIAEINSTSASILKAKQIRNQAVDRLRLDIEDASALTVLYGEPIVFGDDTPAIPQDAPTSPTTAETPAPIETPPVASSESQGDVAAAASEPSPPAPAGNNEYPTCVSDR